MNIIKIMARFTFVIFSLTALCLMWNMYRHDKEYGFEIENIASYLVALGLFCAAITIVFGI